MRGGLNDMSDDLVIHFRDIVMGAFENYSQARQDTTSGRNRHLSSALELATTLYHFREHLPQNIRLSRGAVETACPEYRLIADVTNASKHGSLTRSGPSGPPLLSSSQDIVEMLTLTTFQDEEGEYSNTITVIEIHCRDGVNRSLDDALYKVLNYWVGVINQATSVQFHQAPVPVDPFTLLVSREEASMHSFEAVRGMPWRQVMQLREYNYEKGASEPVDLTGGSVSMRIFQPVTIDVQFEHPDVSGKCEFSLVLNSQESSQFHRLKTDLEKNEFLKSMQIKYRDDIVAKIQKIVEDQLDKNVDS